MKEKLLTLIKCKLQNTTTEFDGLTQDIGLTYKNDEYLISISSAVRFKYVKIGWFKKEKVPYATDHYLTFSEKGIYSYHTKFSCELTTEEFNEVNNLIKLKIELVEKREQKRLSKVLDKELKICAEKEN